MQYGGVGHRAERKKKNLCHIIQRAFLSQLNATYISLEVESVCVIFVVDDDLSLFFIYPDLSYVLKYFTLMNMWLKAWRTGRDGIH